MLTEQKFNSLSILPPGAELRHGSILIANDARIAEGTYQEGLTAYATGIKPNQDIAGTMDSLAPPVRVGRNPIQMKKHDPKAIFLTEDDDIRAIGGSFKEVDRSQQNFFTQVKNKGLSFCMDKDQIGDDTDWQKRYTEWLINRLRLNDLRRVVKGATDAATNTGYVWSTAEGTDPDSDLDTELIASEDVRGQMANKVVFARIAWALRRKAIRAQKSGVQFSPTKPADLAEEMNLDEVRISRELYQSGPTTKSRLITNKVLLYYAQPIIDKDDFSNMKRIWAPCDDGSEYRVLLEEKGKLFILTVEHYSEILIAVTTGLRTMTITAAAA